MGKPRMGHLVLAPAFAVGALLLAGCRSHGPEERVSRASPPPAYTPIPNSGNAFDGYALAALQVEQTAGKQLTRVSYYPDQKKAAMKACASALSDIARASQSPCTFHFVARVPFALAPYQQGWRLLGRVLDWRIDEDCAAANYDGAIDSAVLATKFGFDLCGGGPSDASLGLTIADDARISLAPSLTKMTPSQLKRLSDGIQAALLRKAPVSAIVDNEAQNIRLDEQTLQDAAEHDDFKDLTKQLGPGVKEAVDYLHDIHGNESKLAAYFKGFEAEGDQMVKWLRDNGAKPKAGRDAEPKFDKGTERPWKRFAFHFFTAAFPMLKMDDRTIARTRLLIINAELIKGAKEQAEAKGDSSTYPANLNDFPHDITKDPYTGKPFLYHAEKAVFSVYSVGENLRDDAGDTDETFTTPDLKLELKE